MSCFQVKHHVLHIPQPPMRLCSLTLPGQPALPYHTFPALHSFLPPFIKLEGRYCWSVTYNMKQCILPGRMSAISLTHQPPDSFFRYHHIHHLVVGLHRYVRAHDPFPAYDCLHGPGPAQIAVIVPAAVPQPPAVVAA